MAVAVDQYGVVSFDAETYPLLNRMHSFAFRLDASVLVMIDGYDEGMADRMDAEKLRALAADLEKFASELEAGALTQE